MEEVSEVTRLLRSHRCGDDGALDALFQFLYAELRRLSRAQLRRGHRPGSIDSTALVHELYIRLADHGRIDWNGKRHFFAVAAKAMRRIVIDYARRGAAAKRRGRDAGELMVESRRGSHSDAVELIALDLALSRLERASPRLAEVVHLRFFVGLSLDDTARTLGLDPSTVKRDWRKARAFLARETVRGPGSPAEA